MRTPSARSAQQLLDEVYRLSQVEAFDVEAYLATLAAEIEDDGAGAGVLDAKIREALAGIDAFTARAMRVRLDHLLADDTSVPAQLRTYLASRVLDYESDLSELRNRVVQVAARVDPSGAAETAFAIEGAADSVLGLRARLRQGALAMLPPEPAEEPDEPQPEPTFFELIELD